MAALKNYYQLLEIAPTATADEVKRAFRQQIARYHPDKVQHLGKEFQDMAADRAAELTEAYRVLSDDGRRSEYDRARAEAGATPTPPNAAAPGPRSATAAAERPRKPQTTTRPTAAEPAGSHGAQFTQDRASRDEFVRKATITRFRQALDAIDSGYNDVTVHGFDVAWVPKASLFGRRKGPRLLGRFVSRVDRAAVADALVQAAKWRAASGDDVCIFLMACAMAPAGELAAEIAEQRRKERGAKLILVPIDVRAWDARMPLDAPEIAKTVLARLKAGG